MSEKTAFHSICAWTFHSGAGGFTPGNIRPSWSADKFVTVDKIRLIAEKIKPRLPDHIDLGFEMHYDNEFNEENAESVALALNEHGIYLAMTTPGAHRRFGYGGIASLDPNERKAAEEFGERTVDLTYGPLRKAWHPDADMAPAFVIWNGSFGYDLATVGIREMYKNLKESVAKLCEYEEKKGEKLFLAIEPKPNEGHPAMLLPTVSSALLFWLRLEEEYGVSLWKKGINKEFGHTEMIGLDHVLDTVEELDNGAVVHMHMNSQGYNDGIVLGGPGKFDIDHGVRINGMNITIAKLINDAGYSRWKGHDMQPRPYDNEEQAVERVIRSILSWEACNAASMELDTEKLVGFLIDRDTASAEDMMRDSAVRASGYFKELSH